MFHSSPWTITVLSPYAPSTTLIRQNVIAKFLTQATYSCGLRFVEPRVWLSISMSDIIKIIVNAKGENCGIVHIYIVCRSMHAYMHANMQACIHAYTHTCIRTYTPTHMRAYMHTCIHAYMHKCIHAYMLTYIHAHSHACKHIEIKRYETVYKYKDIQLHK